MMTYIYGQRLEELALAFRKYFQLIPVKAMRGCLFANKENQLAEFADNVFQAYWSEGKDISQEDFAGQSC
jgi:predicted DsbA family dithiol-disulfide isomerase